jgi:hypothetical protein
MDTVLKNPSIMPKYIKRSYDVKKGCDGAFVLFDPNIKGDFGDQIIGFFKTLSEAEDAAKNPNFKKNQLPAEDSFDAGDIAVAINDIDIGFSDGGRSPRITIPQGTDFKVESTYVDGDTDMLEILYNKENLKVEAYKFRKTTKKW